MSRRNRATRRRTTVEPAAPDVRYPAGIAAYPGDCSHIVGEIKGPTTFGGLAVATSADYAEYTGVTIVQFSTCPPDEPAVRGADGIVRVAVTS